MVIGCHWLSLVVIGCHFEFEVWNLFGIWNLEFGIYFLRYFRIASLLVLTCSFS